MEELMNFIVDSQNHGSVGITVRPTLGDINAGRWLEITFLGIGGGTTRIRMDPPTALTLKQMLEQGLVDVQSLVTVDGETQKLLDAATEQQEAGACTDVEGWASGLANDVKDAGD